MKKEKILVIRLGALGDLVLCAQVFASIRRNHPEAEIALLTMPSFVFFARLMPWFNSIITDPRPSAWDLKAWMKLIRDVRSFAPTHVYDFQGKPRQSVLFWALGGVLSGIKWSGAAQGCSHPRFWPPQKEMHYTDFAAAQLKAANVPVIDDYEMDWLKGGQEDVLKDLDLPARFALLIPGCAPTRLYKRWPPESYAALAKRLEEEEGLRSVIIGTKAEADATDKIAALHPSALNLCGKTSLPQIGALAARAIVTIGNDTGPTHIAAAVGGRTLALISPQVNPIWSAPKTPRAAYLQALLTDLTPDTVFEKVRSMISGVK